MASLEHKKATMTAVLIHPDARMILSLPDNVKTYADLERWTVGNGKNVPIALQEAFKAKFETHFQEYEAMNMSRESMTQTTAPEENQSPKENHLVDAFGIPVTEHNISSGGSQPDPFNGNPRKTSAGPSSAADKSFARQLQLMGVGPGRHPNLESHDGTGAARARALGHRRTDARDLGQGYPVGARSTRGVESDRATESFTRQITAPSITREKEDSMEVAARAARQAMGDNSERFQAYKKQEEDEEEEL